MSWRLALLVAVGALIVYAGSFRALQSSDPATNVFVAYSLVREGDPFLDEYEVLRDRFSYWSFAVGGREVSPYPPGAALWGLPFVALGALLGVAPPAEIAVNVVGRLAAAVAAAASVGVVFLIAQRLAGARVAVVTAALYGFGTATWPMSAGALWQHAPAQLFLALGLLALLPGPAGPRAGLAGAAFGVATLVRIPDGLFLAAAGATMLLAYGRGPAIRFALGAALPLGVLLAHQTWIFGSPFDTTYAAFNLRSEREPLVGLLGNLVSPGRGLLVYSPFLIAGIVALVRRASVRDQLALMLRGQLLAAAGILVLYASAVDWWGGHGYSNRYLADTLPLLSLGVALWLRESHARATWVLLAIACAWAVALSFVGALFYDWQEWSWDRSGPGRELPWRMDPPLWLYMAQRATFDALTIASLAFIAAGAAVFARAYVLARRVAA